MNLTADRAATAVERHDCPNCGAPAGSACRTRGGKTTAKYHTARFGLVPALRGLTFGREADSRFVTDASTTGVLPVTAARRGSRGV